MEYNPTRVLYSILDSLWRSDLALILIGLSGRGCDRDKVLRTSAG